MWDTKPSHKRLGCQQWTVDRCQLSAWLRGMLSQGMIADNPNF